MRSKLQEEIQTLKWQEDILDKQLEVICFCYQIYFNTIYLFINVFFNSVR